MALAFSERYDTGGAQEGSGWSGFIAQNHTRRFNVPGAYEADALNHASLVAVTQTVHPRFPNLVPVGVRAVERIGATDGWVVEVEYGINRMAGGSLPPPPDSTNTSYRSQELSSRIDTITIPVMGFTPVWMVVPGLVPTYSSIATNWKRYDIKRVLVMSQYTVRLNVANMTQAQFFTINTTTGKIHQFGGRKWLFQGADCDEREDKVWQIVYTWMSDPGTPALTIPTVAGSTQAMLTTPQRPAFNEYVVRNYTNNQNLEFFDITVVGTYEDDLNGHLTLPGTPI